MTENDLDLAAMDRLKGGDDLALNEIMERWQLRVTSFLLRMVSDQAAAVDLAQETFVRVYKHRLRYRPSGAFSTWLFAIAANLARQHLRWLRRHPSVALDAPDDKGVAAIDQVPSTSGDPSQMAVRDEQARQVQLAVGALPHDLREALVLFVYEELSQSEIAEILGCSRKAVETRIYRARQILRRELLRSIS